MGTAGALSISPFIASNFSLSTPILLGVLLLLIGFVSFIVSFVMAEALDTPTQAVAETQSNEEEEKYKNVTIKDQTFKIRFVSPKDKVLVSKRRMSLQGDAKIEAMTADEFMHMENIALIDVCTEEYPKGFNSTESCINWLDGELIEQLADEIRKHTSDIQGKLKKNRPLNGVE